MRYSSAKRVTKHTASGSSALTCKIGASIIFATSEQYSVERASRGSLVVNPTWLLMMMWTDAAGVEAARLRQLQGLHDDALAREGRIAVDLHRQHLVAARIAAPLLARARRAFDHRVHDLEMRGIERQRHVHIARRGFQVGGESLVILHVARTAQFGEVVLALEFAEQILRRFAEQVHQHIEPAAMRHADDGFLDAGAAALLHQIVEQAG